MKKQKDKEEDYYNWNLHDLKPLAVRDMVRIQPRNNSASQIWEKGEIAECLCNRSYLVKPGGHQYQRNRRQLRFVAKVKEGPSEDIISQDANLESATPRDSESEVDEEPQQREQTTMEDPHQELAQPTEKKAVTLKDSEGTQVQRMNSGRVVRRPKYLTDNVQGTS